jgi:hypothetical protein
MHVIRFLRWHYPGQVIRVAFTVKASQPGISRLPCSVCVKVNGSGMIGGSWMVVK